MKILYFFTLVVFITSPAFAQTKHKTENVVLITLDGFRWQEVFRGADSVFMKQQAHLKDKELKQKYWRDDLAARRKALMPFVWGTIATQGQLYGNRDRGSLMNVTNTMWFSYPGYNELLTGKADDAHIDSNDKNYNPNTNVLEFINQQPAFKGKVAAFTSWDCFPYIINDKRSGVFVSAGLVPAQGNKLTEKESTLSQLMFAIPNPLGDVRLDAFTFYLGLEYIKKNKPRAMYFAFDETDDFAHAGEYAAYLNAARYTDGFIGELWQYLQNDPQYKGKTTVIITCDHGRGPTTENWKHHGKEHAESDQVWMAVIGPDTPAGGEISGGTQVYQKQIAKTLASFLGLNFTGSAGAAEGISTAMK